VLQFALSAFLASAVIVKSLQKPTLRGFLLISSLIHLAGSMTKAQLLIVSLSFDDAFSSVENLVSFLLELT
jgi:hypothetical protein